MQKGRTWLTLVLALSLTICSLAEAPSQTPVTVGPLGQWVNPFVGTGGIPWVCGHNFPGAMVPFGMVRLGPETMSTLLRKRALNTSGYYYGDDQILGFSHTRLNGTGATDGGHFLIVPTQESLQPKSYRLGHTLGFSHSQETASPGYYSVKLPRIDAQVELTATPRVGVHRYTFNQGANPHLLIDVMNALGGKKSSEGSLLVRPEAKEVAGSVRTFGTFSGRHGGIKVYFVAQFSQPFTTFQTWENDSVFPGKTNATGDRIAVDLGFGSQKSPTVITLQLAISYVSLENARGNLKAEAEKRGFDEIQAAARDAWEKKLSLISLQGGSKKQRSIFYTALYRTFQMPTVFNDANGDYLGFDQKVHRVDDYQYFTDLSLWDTFRTVHPLYTLIAPRDQRNMMVSLVKMLEQGGWLPRWPAGAGYSNSMLGTPADIVIADTYLKGIRDFDIQKAYQGMRITALGPTPKGSAFSGRKGISDYLKYQYCPSDLMDESVSRTLEFGWSDHAISQLAESLGYRADAKLFGDHARFYQNLWNPKTHYFQPRDTQGKFGEPFNPLLLTYLDRGKKLTKDYVEGSALQWRWAVPYDPKGLIALFPNQETFVEELNQFFSKSDPAMGAWNPGPYYWHGNQPDIAAAYLFNDANRPDLTQKWSRWILDNKYGDGPTGLDGNDDGGTLSAWYVLSALGLYPMAGSDIYQLGGPLFEKAEITMNGKPLRILTENHAENHHYVDKVTLNGKVLNRSWIRHGEIADGGTLLFHRSANPTQKR